MTRRAPSLPARHLDWDFRVKGDVLPRVSCPGKVAIYVTPSALPIYEAQVVVRCELCGKALEARGVVTLGWYSEPWVDADSADCDDAPWGV